MTLTHPGTQGLPGGAEGAATLATYTVLFSPARTKTGVEFAGKEVVAGLRTDPNEYDVIEFSAAFAM
jgi:hypothetical protein